MYFKTAKDSETGKKLAEVYQKGSDAWDARNDLMGELMEEYPAMTGRFLDPGGLVIWGGIYAIEFSEEPDPSLWINVEDKQYAPIDLTEEGEKLCKRIKELPAVKYTDINAVFNHDNPQNRMGFKVGEKYFGLEWHPEWGIHTPADCEEILYSEYKDL